MKEKFYCVGCKQHYELPVHAAQRQPSKGGSFRHSLISECPKGHRVNKLCKKEVYEAYETSISDAETFESPYVGSKALSGISLTTDQLTETIGSGDFDKASLNSSGHQNVFANAEEEGSAPVQDPMEFGEMANWTPLDGTPSLRKRKRAEGMTVGVGLEALEPTPDEPESGESMVPADSLMPEGSGHVIGSQSTSHNFTPFHAEGQKYPCDSCNKMVSRSDLKVMMGSYDEDYQVCQDCLTYDAETEVHDAESFIAYPELKDHLVSIMPNKVYDIVELDDGDFEMKVASRNMDEVIATVSEYQIKEKSESDFAFGKSKTTVAVAAAGVALMGAWLWNKRK